jgi:hypothetical protein
MEIYVIVGIVVLVLFLAVNSNASGGDVSSGPNSINPFVNALAEAIANAENVDVSANNPGALTSGDVTAASITGSFNSAGVVTIDTLQNGWDALTAKLENIMNGLSTVFNPSMTIQQFAAMYTTGDENDTSDATNNYAQSLADSLGVSTDTTLEDASQQ